MELKEATTAEKKKKREGKERKSDHWLQWQRDGAAKPVWQS